MVMMKKLLAKPSAASDALHCLAPSTNPKCERKPCQLLLSHRSGMHIYDNVPLDDECDWVKVDRVLQ